MCWERLLKCIQINIFLSFIRKGDYVVLVLKLVSHDPTVLKTNLAQFKYYFATPSN